MNKTAELHRILDENNDKRIVVVGTTCSGKTTILKSIPEAHDMDELVFPLLSQAEKDYVNQTPWTEEIGQVMTRLTKERVQIKPGEPVFGTVVLEADLIIYLKISDELLRDRTQTRSVSFDDTKNMQQQIEKEIKESQLPVIEFLV